MSSLARLATSLPLLVALGLPAVAAPRGLDHDRLAALRWVDEAAIAPDGSRIAWVERVPRRIGRDPDGPAFASLWVADDGAPTGRPWVERLRSIEAVRFTPDGAAITFLGRRDDDAASLWRIPADGGEARRVLEGDEPVRAYAVAPSGDRVAWVAHDPAAPGDEAADAMGYDQEVFEEDWRAERLWVGALPPLVERPSDPAEPAAAPPAPTAFELDGSVFGVTWSADGSLLAVDVAPRPLIDDRYVARRIGLIDPVSRAVRGRVEHAGKLGAIAPSPDGRRVAFVGAADPHDPAAGRLLLAPLGGGPPRDLLPDLEGHVADIAWQDAATVMFVADVGAGSVFGEVDVPSGATKTHAVSGDGGPVLRSLALSADGTRAAFVAETPEHPREAYTMAHGDDGPRRVSDSNPWLGGVELARQEVVRWTARDGLELEGVLLRPLPGTADGPAPLLLMVHGGPESHDANGWVTSYGRPGQVAAARGYAVLYPNYRGSTGRGVAFSKLGQGDAAGPEFDDLLDAVDALAARGVADPERVGITGGSYGGYATAWCSTRHTGRFRAGVMFVGISNKTTKPLTTDIPLEDTAVHTLYDPWTRWEFGRERSPLGYAEQSRTALLIAGGTSDTRIDPSQSLQLYRALKLIGKTPVRYVRYPGEPHGNLDSASRDDYSRRLLRWMDWFVVEDHEGPPPWRGPWIDEAVAAAED